MLYNRNIILYRCIIFCSQQRYARAVTDLKSKDLAITDHKKKNTEVQLRLQESAKLYDIIKVRNNI